MCLRFYVFALGGLTAMQQRNINAASARKNLNENYQSPAEQQQQQLQPLQPSYADLTSNQSLHVHNTASALKELATKNGYSVPLESLGREANHVQPLEATCTSKSDSNVSHAGAVQEIDPLQQVFNSEQITNIPAPIAGKRRRSSKSNHSSVTEKGKNVEVPPDVLLVNHEQVISNQENKKQSRTSPVEPGVIHQNRRRSSRSSIKSVEQNAILEEEEIVVMDSSFSSNNDINTNLSSTREPCVQWIDSSGKEIYHDKISKKSIPDPLNIASPNSVITDVIKSPGGTPLREMQLCIPKLIIKKVRQRKGSQEFETHEVRAVEPMEEEENEAPKRGKKRRRSSSDGTLTEKEDEEERG